MDQEPLISVMQCLNKTNQMDKIPIRLRGWARSVRIQKKITFISLYDGSDFRCLQLVVPEDVVDGSLEPGAALSVIGSLCPSPGRNQAFELQVTYLKILAECPAAIFPLQRKEHSFEFLRTIAHLRCRSKSLTAIMRIRHALTLATHSFFSLRGFCCLSTPILSPINSEGAGDIFSVNKEDSEKEFFGQPAYLTVSGQLHAEAFACGMGPVYTFGPTFRAENSNTTRHLAEFWMVEPEIPFADLFDLMECAETYLCFCIRWCLERCVEELLFCQEKFRATLLSELYNYIERPFIKISYTDAIEILHKSNTSFFIPPVWGIDLQTEHERFLTEQYAKAPVIVFDFPAEKKAFYMRLNQDEKTVASMDILFPILGEVVGGSQREERLFILQEQMKKKEIPLEPYWWYLDLRRFASIVHSGFGAGFERIVRLVTGADNIREVIPFPRAPDMLDF